MSTSNNIPTPPSGQPSKPAAAWYPNLAGSNLSQGVQNGITQSYSLIYSLRDTVNSAQVTMGRMLNYGTNQQLLQVNAQTVPDGAMWFTTDPATTVDASGNPVGGKVYQAQINPNSTTRTWVLIVNGVIGGGPPPSSI